MMTDIYPIILAGGVGTRLWPLSRELYPKQLLAIASDKTLLQETLLRVKNFLPGVIVCNHQHRFIIAEQAREVNYRFQTILLEPCGRNSAPATALAALFLEKINPDALMLILPADHVIDDVSAFEEAVYKAVLAAQQNHLVNFGVNPTRAETGYGYIKYAQPLLSAPGCFTVKQFIEKPDQPTANHYWLSGDFLWNSGMLLSKASCYLQELQKFHPAIITQCQQALSASYQDIDFLRIDSKAFAAAENISVDCAVLEKTNQAAVLPVNFNWNDIGSWSAIWDIKKHDDNNNVTQGPIVSEDIQGCYLHSEGPLLAAVGLKDTIVVVTDDAVLVTPLARAQETKKMVAYLKQQGHTQHLAHNKVYRPWGWYKELEVSEHFKVKNIMVMPGKKLSLQLHQHRAEHWIIVSGRAWVECENRTFWLEQNQSTYIPIGAKHRLENRTEQPLHVIEVQTGEYLAEEDIIRFSDAYGRENII